MNISVIAFGLMAVITVVIFAAIVVIEWRHRPHTKDLKNGLSPVQETDHPAALMEYPILNSHPLPESHREPMISNS